MSKLEKFFWIPPESATISNVTAEKTAMVASSMHIDVFDIEHKEVTILNDNMQYRDFVLWIDIFSVHQT